MTENNVDIHVHPSNQTEQRVLCDQDNFEWWGIKLGAALGILFGGIGGTMLVLSPFFTLGIATIPALLGVLIISSIWGGACGAVAGMLLGNTVAQLANYCHASWQRICGRCQQLVNKWEQRVYTQHHDTDHNKHSVVRKHPAGQYQNTFIYGNWMGDHSQKNRQQTVTDNASAQATHFPAERLRARLAGL